MISERVREGLERFDRAGQFGETDYQELRRALSPVVAPRSAQGDLLDGLINLFFERHVMDDERRAELLALSGEELVRALRHRFRQVIADEHDDRLPFHALRAHVRDALAAIPPDGSPPDDAPWPVSLRVRGQFDRAQVEAAVRALWREGGQRPSVRDATFELLRRYQDAHGLPEVSEAHDVPEAIRRRLDGQRLASNILELLTVQERGLLRHVLEDGTVEAWAGEQGCSRATAYRLMARLKTLCRLEFAQRSDGTQLEALQALRGRLVSG